MRPAGRDNGLAWAIIALVVVASTLIGIRGAHAAQSSRSVVTAAQLSGDNSSTTFALTMSRGVTAEIFTLASPYRVIIDLPNLDFRLKSGTGQTGHGLVSTFRYGLFAESKARVVIDTTGPVKIAGANMTRVSGGNSMVLNVILEPTDSASFGAGTGASRAPEGVAARESDQPEDVPPESKKPRAKPIIVIDPGHGGIDPGAIGLSNIAEKTLVLAVAKQLKSALVATGSYEVKMTRATDVFVSLDDRLNFSRKNGADLFLSLHADAIEKSYAETIRGATIYTLSEDASDEQARQMAEKENASDLLAGLHVTDADGQDQVKNILIDLLKRETANFSTDFSNVLAKRLGSTITMSRIPQRSAAFKVLKQTHAPSVLIELGYVSNPKDHEQMTSRQWQAKVAASIAAAVQTYFSKRLAEHP
jgi:N-acetylmuramoyl-L-alanine amidase